MEFGIFVQGYVPGPDAHDPQKEHEAFMREIEIVKAADKVGWKDMWATEHHGLPEYSHISSNEVFLGYLAGQTQNIHLGSGIFNLSPRVNHPVRNAERATMLDQLSSGRFEMGTGRGAGSHETATFNILEASSTRDEWDEVIAELPRMWAQKDYTFEGRHFKVPTPHDILPKPYGGGHPPLWVACGSPSTFEKAGRLGIGALGFNFAPIREMKPQIDSYKQGIAECTEPVGAFVNDNVMVTNALRCFEDRDRARTIALRGNAGYLYSLVCLYHDSFPKPDDAPVWPDEPQSIPEEFIEEAINEGFLLCGNPDEVCEQLVAYEETGVDQLVFGMPVDMSLDEALECIELFGTKVIPQFDRDPEHRTTKFRRTAQQKYPAYAQEPAHIETAMNR